jgi:hypothetical protein
MSAGAIDVEALLQAAADAGTDNNVLTFMQAMVNEVSVLKATNASLSSSNANMAVKILDLESQAAISPMKPIPPPYVFLENIEIGNVIRRNSEHLDRPWDNDIKLKNKFGDPVEFFTTDYIIQDEAYYKEKFPKQSSRSTTMPNYGSGFKTNKDYLKLLVDYGAFLKAGGVPNIPMLLGPHLELFSDAVGVTPSEMVQLTNTGFFAVVLHAKWYPPTWEEIKEELKTIKLRNYGMPTLDDTVRSYIIKLTRALRGRPYKDREYADYIECNISDSFALWKDKLSCLGDYGLICKKLKELSDDHVRQYLEKGLELPKDKYVPKNQIKAIITPPVPDVIFMPKKGRECEVCHKKYMDGQIHGFAINIDKSGNVKLLCPDRDKDQAHKDALQAVITKVKLARGII